MFQANEAMLRRYDELLDQREADMKLYKAMRRGDYSHMQLPERPPLGNPYDPSKSLTQQILEDIGRKRPLVADDAASETSQPSKRRRPDDSRLASGLASNYDAMSHGEGERPRGRKSGTPRGSGGSAKGSRSKADEEVSYRRKRVDARSENVPEN